MKNMQILEFTIKFCHWHFVIRPTLRLQHTDQQLETADVFSVIEALRFPHT